MCDLAAACSSTGLAKMEYELAMTTSRFTDYLGDAGVIATAIPKPSAASSVEKLYMELDHLPPVSLAVSNAP